MPDDDQIRIPIFVDDEDGVRGAVPPGDDVFFSDVGTRGRPSGRPGGRPGGAARRVGAVARDSYGPALEVAEQAVREAAARFRALGNAVRPDEIEMQFGITVKGEGTVGIAKAGAESQIRFTFRWHTAAVPVIPSPRVDEQVTQDGTESGEAAASDGQPEPQS
ncbi:CU044_2847 family protein [Streptomyces sp. NPDC047130]|uniref:CU044_2847 family protein n=1 Tax=Streptomyces sp. NPDC047130 TaxID=3155261 RepID=UPI00340415CE